MAESRSYRYAEVAEALRKLINTGALQVGDRLPGEREIARMMQVSQMTANRAIRQLVAEGYLKREVGVGTFVVSKDPLPKDRNVRIHVVLFGEASPDLVDRDGAYVGPLWRAIWHEGAKQRCNFVFFQAAEEGALSNYVSSLDPEKDRLLLLTPPSNYVEEITALHRQGQFKFVVLGAHWKHTDIPYVDCDNGLAAEMAVDYLADLGHTNIAYVATWLEHQNTRDRIEGYQRALKRRGLRPHPSLQIVLHPDELNDETFYLHVKNVLSLDLEARPTAIIAFGYLLVLGVRKALARSGVSVPDDVSLIGFDDAISVEFLHPPLTMIRQPLERMGSIAVRKLLQGEGRIAELLPAELVKRQSVRFVASRTDGP